MVKVQFYDSDGDSFIRNEFTMVITIHNHKIPVRRLSIKLINDYKLLEKIVSERVKQIAQWN